MEKKFKQGTDDWGFSLKLPKMGSSSYLISLIPKSVRGQFTDSEKDDQFIYKCLSSLPSYGKVDELSNLFQELGADLFVWQSKATSEEKTQYLLDCLSKNVEEGIKKLTAQTTAYLNSAGNSRKTDLSKVIKTKGKNSDFDWLTLNTKNEMLKSKLKTKLVQAINQFKNEKKLREVMGRELEEHQKIHLEDEEIQIYQDQMSKINYEWTLDDEQMFIDNIKSLKEKFLKTEFLKNCQRFKFITDSQIRTLASEEISRKLDKSNKAFLSREFLLDKYFSTRETLTEKQMKFILKTSPLLSKCVDKAFVRAAIKNIQYEDIDRMELQIAEEIIEKFEMIRNLVKSSRKAYKQRQNNQAKERIRRFEKAQKYEELRCDLNEHLQKHKSKMIRNMNYRRNNRDEADKEIEKSKENIRKQDDLGGKSPQKMVWPIPLNKSHPSTGLFIKDCSEQINDEFNNYEKCYLKTVFSPNHETRLPKNAANQSSMIKFYTGGPIEAGSINKSLSSSLLCSNPNSGKKSENIVTVLCEAFKSIEYQKALNQKLNSCELEQFEAYCVLERNNSTVFKGILDMGSTDSRRNKKQGGPEEPTNEININIISPTEKAIKDKLLEGKEKAKMSVFTKKLHALAAENSLMSLKALNAKFTPAQINSYDSKGNTALYYATKNKNASFIDYLLGLKADINARCSKGGTPLHNAFKSSNYAIICKCLAGAYPPNLNALDDDGKTPLAYCCRKVLEMLGLESGVVSVDPSSKVKFNNNSLLCIQSDENNPADRLELKTQLKKREPARQLLGVF